MLEEERRVTGVLDQGQHSLDDYYLGSGVSALVKVYVLFHVSSRCLQRVTLA